MEKQTRVPKIATEESLGKFSVKHPGFTWLVEHAADVLTKLNVGVDGMTAYEKIKGRAYSGMTMEFGLAVLYKNSAKVEGGVMQPRCSKGVAGFTYMHWVPTRGWNPRASSITRTTSCHI